MTAETVTLPVAGMTCGNCARSVERKLSSTSGVSRATVNLDAASATVEFDPSQITYDELLDIFWSNHNPTTLNRQGPDVGTQYRSVIFYHSPEQKSTAEASRKKVDTSRRFGRPVVTQIEPAPKFWRAEEYHQRYLQKRGKSHCAI